ncbi:hypothetical protein BsWGS_09740 [Bradybaena similaris]
MNITAAEGATYGGIIISLGLGVIFASGSMAAYTFITPPDNMKTAEKLIVYNLLGPDFALGSLLAHLFGPAIINQNWPYSKFSTQCLAFIHAACVYHANVAAGFICYIVAMALRDAYRFEGSNNIKHMSALVISSLSLTICFCSLPATEKGGFAYLDNWLGPWYDIKYQYGSLFMVVALSGLIVILDITSIVNLFRTKWLFTQEGSKISKRALDDVNKLIIFVIMNTLCGLPTMLVAFVATTKASVLMIRFALYVCPLLRVVMLLYLCPHFQFGRSVISTQDLDDYTKLGEEGAIDTTSDRLYNIIEGEDAGDDGAEDA